MKHQIKSLQKILNTSVLTRDGFIFVFILFGIFSVLCLFLATAYTIETSTKYNQLDSKISSVQEDVRRLDKPFALTTDSNLENQVSNLESKLAGIETLLVDFEGIEYTETVETAHIDTTNDQDQAYFVLIFETYPGVQTELYGLGEHANVGAHELLTENDNEFYFAVSSIPVECYDIHNTGRCDTFDQVIEESNKDLQKFGGIWKFDRQSHEFSHVVIMQSFSEINIDPGYFLGFKIDDGVISFQSNVDDRRYIVLYSTQSGELSAIQTSGDM